MFYNDSAVPLDIFSVSKLSWSSSSVTVRPRTHAALVYRIKGNADFTFDDGTEIATVTGEVFYCPANVGYKVKYDDGEVIALHFKGDGFGNLPEVVKASDCVNARELFEKAYSVWNENNRSSRLELISVLFGILAVCSSGEKSNIQIESSYDKAAKYFLDNAFEGDFLISDICSKFYVSESGFRKYFGLKYGASPIKYITELRLRRAEILLLETSDTVESIAMQCGYPDVKYFCRVFYKHRKCTPTHFRLY